MYTWHHNSISTCSTTRCTCINDCCCCATACCCCSCFTLASKSSGVSLGSWLVNWVRLEAKKKKSCQNKPSPVNSLHYQWLIIRVSVKFYFPPSCAFLRFHYILLIICLLSNVYTYQQYLHTSQCCLNIILLAIAQDCWNYISCLINPGNN